MQFSLDVWHDYRNKARSIGDVIMSFKNKETNAYEGISSEERQALINEITTILDQCNNYMDACGLCTPGTSMERFNAFN